MRLVLVRGAEVQAFGSSGKGKLLVHTAEQDTGRSGRITLGAVCSAHLASQQLQAWCEWEP